MESLERERDVAIQEGGVQEALSSVYCAAYETRDRAVRERDAQVALLDLWLVAIWPSVEGDTDDPGPRELP